jgi:hypothetical protein
MGRIILCTKDVQQFTGKSNRSARDMLNKVRRALNKPGHLITVFEFAEYYGIPIRYIIDFLR